MQKKKTYKELLDSMSYRELGYTGAPSVTDPKLKAFNDTILKNDEISQTKINTTPIIKGQRRANATGDQVDAETPTATPVAETLTTNNTYADFTKWAQEHGVDADKVFQDAMALARTQYEQARATYGLQAEQLAQAGLTNSGVSDNMERVAYAQKVQAEQAALDQKAALEQANKEGFATYQEEQKQKQQQYNDAYMTLRKGYEDDNGVYHPPVSHEMAIAQLKYAGLNDETLLANTQSAYAQFEAQETADKEATQNAIGGVDETTGGFSDTSLLGKLLSGEMDSTTFLSDVKQQYGIEAATDEEAVDALTEAGKISKEQQSLFYKKMYENAFEAIKDIGNDIESGESSLYTLVSSAQQAYKEGKLSKADWDAMRMGIMKGDSDVSISVENTSSNVWDELSFTIKIGDNSETYTIPNASTRRVTDTKDVERLDSLSGGTNYAVYNGELYVKITGNVVASTGHKKGVVSRRSEVFWVRVKGVSRTSRVNIKQILKILAEPTT